MNAAKSETPAKPWSVKRLADHWGCSPSTIYTMIEEGRLTAFRLGTRGVRIKDEERLRCENGEGATSTGTANSLSAGADVRPSLTTTMRMANAGARG